MKHTRTHSCIHGQADVHIRPVVKRYSRWLSPYHLFLVFLDHVQSVDVKHLVGIHGYQDTSSVRLKTFRISVGKGLCKEKIQKTRDYYVSVWVGTGLTRYFCCCGKSSQNCPKPVVIFWSSIPCVFCMYTLLKVVGYYDLSVQSMSVMGFQKNWMGGGWMG